MADVAKTAPLAERLVAGDKRALARAITLIESDDPAGWELVREVYPRTGKARIVGFTGPPGVGKSTLIGALTAELRKAERQVAVLSIDPSSPFTRGALLGDRIRLSDHFLDPGVFIRSMASRGALGGLSEAALQVALAMDAAGKDDVLIETVGVGQAEIDIVDHADTIVLALMPGSGDSIQALKAGVMEIPDVIVVNKADHPMTDTMVREVRGVLALSHDPEGWKVPILRTEAARGEGVAELAEQIDEHRAHIEAEGTLEERRARNLRSEVLGIATSRMRRRLEATAAGGPARPRSCSSGSCGASSTPPAPPRSCWRGRPMAERRQRPALAAGGAGLARPPGRRARRRQGGPGRGFFVDAESGEPSWLIAKLRPLRAAGWSRCRCAIAPAGAGSAWVAHEGRDDPRRPGRRPDPAAAARARADDLRPLRDRRGLGRAAEVGGRKEGTITSRPRRRRSFLVTFSS